MAAAVVGVNKFGFPLVTCGRCGGSGYYGPLQVQAGKCFGCGGTGHKVRAGKARAAWVEFVAAWRKAGQVLAGEVTGPIVVWSGGYKGVGEKLEIAGPPVINSEPCGWSGSGEKQVVTAWRCELPLVGGGVKKCSTMNIFAVVNPVRPSPEPFLAGITWPGKK